jgi:hypothetical protein
MLLAFGLSLMPKRWRPKVKLKEMRQAMSDKL